MKDDSLYRPSLAAIVGPERRQIHVDFIVRNLEALGEHALFKPGGGSVQLVTHPVLDQFMYCPVDLPQPRGLLLVADSGHCRRDVVMVGVEVV